MAFNRNKSLTKAQKLLQKGKIQDAIKEYQQVVENDPSDVRTLLKVGDLQAKVGSVEAACDTYRRVGEHYAKDGFFLKAVAVFKQILKLDPGLIKVYLRLAELYQQLGLNSEAMKQYQIVVRHYENQGLKKESLDVLKKMAELDPENTASKVKLAELYAKEGHTEAATEQFKTVTEDLKAKRNFQDLAKVAEKMEALGLADDEMKCELSEIYLKIAEPKKALEILQKLFQSSSKNERVLELLARSFIDLQQPEKAKSVYTELLGVLDEKGLIEEKERISAKLKTLGFKVPATPSVEGVPAVEDELEVIEPEDDLAVSESESVPSPSPSSSSPASTSDSPSKIFDEIDVFLKYGLVEKACTTLQRMVVADPSDSRIRAKLIEAFRTKGDLPGLKQVLEDASKVACASGQDEVVAELTQEIAQLSGDSAPEISSVETSSEELVEDEVVLLEEESEKDQAPMEGFERESEGADAEFSLDEDLEIVADDFEVEVEDEPGSGEVAESESLEISSGPSIEFDASEFEASPEDDSNALEMNLDAELASEDFEIPSEDSSFEVSEETSDSNEEKTFFEPNVESDLEIEPEPSVESGDSVESEVEPSLEVAPELESESVEMEVSVEPEASLESLSSPEVELESEFEEGPEAEDELLLDEEDDSALEASEEKVVIEDEDETPFGTELEEAAFFVQEGLIDEAVDIYESIIESDPNHVEAKERLAEIQQAQPSTPVSRPVLKEEGPEEVRPERRGSERKAVMKVLSDEVSEASPETQRVMQSGDSMFDLSSELEDEIQELEGQLFQKKGDQEEYLSPEEVITEFKKGIARTVSKGDFQTHYNLGIAYKEMGLLDEAIHEFDLASADPKISIDCASMIGLCLMGKREFNEAIDVYRKALAQTKPSSEEALGLSYELAEAYIGHGKIQEAYKLFARINDVDPTFRDARRRTKELEADLGASAPPHSAPEKESEEDEEVADKKAKKISYI